MDCVLKLDRLPEKKPFIEGIRRAPRRDSVLSEHDMEIALKNALRYFPQKHHAVLAKEFAEELHKYGRIYMYRFRPSYAMYARPIDEYPARSRQAAAIMAMIQNNLDPRVAQHPHELIIYGGNGAIFQNWAQYRLVMQYLATMTDEQTLVMYSGHPLGTPAIRWDSSPATRTPRGSSSPTVWSSPTIPSLTIGRNSTPSAYRNTAR